MTNNLEQPYSTRQQAIKNIQEYSIYRLEEPIKLASGAESNLYVDMEPIALSTKLGEPVLDLLSGQIEDVTRSFHEYGIDIDSIGGVAEGGSRWITRLVGGKFRRPLQNFSVGKPKDHGLGNVVIEAGYPARPQNALLLEDVISTGGSVIRAIQAAETEGITVYGVITIIQRDDVQIIESIDGIIPVFPIFE